MTNEEKKEIAKMIAEALTNNTAPVAPECPTIVPDAEEVQYVKLSDSVEEKASEPVKPVKIPAITHEQTVEVLNEVRLEVRAQFKQPWVQALEEVFLNPVATAVVDGRKKPLIDADQVNAMITHLKKSGKFWPQVVTTVLNEKGEKVYVNYSYKREDGDKWKMGNVVKPEPKIEVLQK